MNLALVNGTFRMKETRKMQATMKWLRTSTTNSSSTFGSHGVADLRFYNAEFCEWGAGEPLVLVPGLAGGIDLIEPLARRLAERFHVIAYQLRGESDCFALRRRFGLNDLASDLAEFITWRRLERPFVLGVSFGGAIALKFAARNSERIAALGLQGVGMRFESNLVQRIASMVLSSYPLPKDCAFFNQFFNVLFGHKASASQLEHVTRTCWQTDQSVMSHRLRLLRRLDFQDLLPQVCVPTMVVGGEKDILVSRKNAQELACALPYGRHTLIKKAGHLAPISHVEETAGALEQFFESIRF